jgi:hypothetical protein
VFAPGNTLCEAISADTQRQITIARFVAHVMNAASTGCGEPDRPMAITLAGAPGPAIFLFSLQRVVTGLA